MIKKLMLSHTAKSMYEECPHKYKLHYIDGYRSKKQSSALLFGNAIDIALNALLTKESDPIEAFEKAWDATENDDIDYYKSDTDEKLLKQCVAEEALATLSADEKSWLSLKLKGHKLIEVYKEEVLPKIKKVVSVQKTIEYDAGNYYIKGVVDLEAEMEDGKVYILDNKTTSTKYKESDINSKDQLPMYGGVLENAACGYITLDKKTFKTKILLGELAPESVKRVKLSFEATAQAINEQLFDMNKKSCYSYGRKCQFYSFCHYGKMAKDIYKKEK